MPIVSLNDSPTTGDCDFLGHHHISTLLVLPNRLSLSGSSSPQNGIGPRDARLNGNSGVLLETRVGDIDRGHIVFLASPFLGLYYAAKQIH
jgi:hypothetical protein